MARRVYKSPRTDPRYLLQKSLLLMAKTLKQLSTRSDAPEVKAESGAIIAPGGLGSKDIDALIGLSSALHRLARQADADDTARARQLKGMSAEQLEEYQRKLKSAERSEAVKEGLRNSALAKEVPMELEDEDDNED